LINQVIGNGTARLSNEQRIDNAQGVERTAVSVFTVLVSTYCCVITSQSINELIQYT